MIKTITISSKDTSLDKHAKKIVLKKIGVKNPAESKLVEVYIDGDGNVVEVEYNFETVDRKLKDIRHDIIDIVNSTNGFATLISLEREKKKIDGYASNIIENISTIINFVREKLSVSSFFDT